MKLKNLALLAVLTIGVSRVFADEVCTADNYRSDGYINDRDKTIELIGKTGKGCALNGKDLRDEDFSGAILINADLEGADIRGANLEGANLSGANLYDASLVMGTYNNHTVFPEGYDPRYLYPDFLPNMIYIDSEVKWDGE